MQNFKPTLPILAAALLAACGGTNQSGIAPIFDDGGPPPKTEDLIGLTFPVHMAHYSADDGPTATADRRTYGLTLTSLTTGELLTSEGTVLLTLVGGDWIGSLNGLDYSLTMEEATNTYAGFLSDQRVGPATDDNRLGHGVFGLQTPLAQLDALQVANASALYAGPSVLNSVVNEQTDSDIGTALIDVNFGTGAVTGDVFDDGGGGRLVIEDGQIADGGFTGTLSFTDPGVILENTDVDGYFYGPDALEAGGTFGGTGTGEGDPVEFSGAFILTQP